MNVTYLQKRVDFLEKAISILLDKHHLKGLQLLQKADCESSNEKYDDYGFRDRFMAYFKRKNKDKDEKISNS
jgi:hypothetical protein